LRSLNSDDKKNNQKQANKPIEVIFTYTNKKKQWKNEAKKEMEQKKEEKYTFQ